MSRYVSLAAICLSLLLVQVSVAQPSQSEERNTMQRFMNLSGLNSSIMLQTELSLAPASEYFNELFIHDPEGLDEQLEGIYDVGELRLALLDSLASDVSVEELEPVMEWFNSPFGQHMVNELLGAQRASQDDIEAYFEDFNPQDPSTGQRLELVNQIVSTKLDTDMYLPVYFTHYEELLSTLDEFSDVEETLGYEDERLSSEQRLSIANQVMEMQVYIHLISLRETPLDDLREYLSFLQTPEGSRYVDVYNKAQIAFLEIAKERHQDRRTERLMDEDEPGAEPVQ